ncbi:hypothetical protein NDU88_003725 [Pleurodeles waltl]|uniref:Soluble ligand binding domain-containing protein n=1 Tax=Pleurodeles waltl TaxID=8319 RepID=A0AAV7NHS0_PLEWA|nr:hypothetical protein NDU88_003725 [Pleurodeles waltl]
MLLCITAAAQEKEACAPRRVRVYRLEEKRPHRRSPIFVGPPPDLIIEAIRKVGSLEGGPPFALGPLSKIVARGRGGDLISGPPVLLDPPNRVPELYSPYLVV